MEKNNPPETSERDLADVVEEMLDLQRSNIANAERDFAARDEHTRNYFAASVAPAVTAAMVSGGSKGEELPELVASLSFRIANAMLKRAKEQS